MYLCAFEINKIFIISERHTREFILRSTLLGKKWHSFENDNILSIKQHE